MRRSSPPTVASQRHGDDGFSSQSPTAWRFDEFVLDAAQYELWRKGEQVRAEPQVHDVLAHLVANHDRVVTREQLVAAVWGAGLGSEGSLSTRRPPKNPPGQSFSTK